MSNSMDDSGSPKTRRKSLHASDTSSSILSKPEFGSPRLESNKRRSSSFASTSSPWFRRNSFLSPLMIQNENFSVYDSPSFFSDNGSYNIISLKECQGFIFNQDLFASPYQQLRSLANERKTRALSFSKSRSRSNSRSQPKSSAAMTGKGCGSPAQRRHTSYDFPRPVFLDSNTSLDNAVIDDEDEDNSTEDKMSESPMEVEENEEEKNNKNTEGDNDESNYHLEEDDEDEDSDEDDNAVINEYDEYDDYEEMSGYGGDSTNRRYKVHVTEIVINEDDIDIFPS
ncbi:uncharacterized protein CANTADRAFT_205702 [Suhomyces tanzawaensis NRRL Y-17324]|uniref:Uncharacterized protein n=1 Tax=Suhomyces tanzawaensis NRRL Y-17324 TaxID=984487 RepID=A0A1E4SJF5_9ASCO|nr:uncharacterized protein CANTADRAFT_205702 [Suhomyces tanzawaensis NRRL Y-17324]ODV79620.1 hypothetical protein CANTADRAFT_205702 [Suhomyces tanzawaensis NRRL Y-17324]